MIYLYIGFGFVVVALAILSLIAKKFNDSKDIDHIDLELSNLQPDRSPTLGEVLNAPAEKVIEVLQKQVDYLEAQVHPDKTDEQKRDETLNGVLASKDTANLIESTSKDISEGMDKVVALKELKSRASKIKSSKKQLTKPSVKRKIKEDKKRTKTKKPTNSPVKKATKKKSLKK